ncbi:SWIM zinc finger family protein [Propionibacteriaceae bacterium G1746]|uniref:SWIM zinc finger family protein n=1 Tax=Aestuariimicrobium sp. G57 TaxID=3418485 RepID=UPI003C241D94
MTRPDILALSAGALADLTNKGTLRRAQKQVDDPATSWTITESATSDVHVEFDDATRCELAAGQAFADWTCSCAAAQECRHLVAAVLAYQRDAGLTGAEPVAAGPADKAPSTAIPAAHEQLPYEQLPHEQLPHEQPATPFDPAHITDEALAAALAPATLRAAAALVAAGPLAHVGTSAGINIVRLHHPVGVTVRFLAGADLAYARCSCRRPDPCLHVPVAVAAARGTTHGQSGLRAAPTAEAWQPDPQVLDEARRLTEELIRVGVEASHRALLGPWQRLAQRASAAQLHHVADLVDEIGEEAARYSGADARFDPDRLVALCGELLTRAASLRGHHPGRVPDRLVAGAAAEAEPVGRAKLVGMGTEVIESGDRVRLIVHLVEARSGAPLRVTRTLDDPQLRDGWQLARGTLGSIPLHQWGSGQVMTTSGNISGHGEFSPGNRRVTGIPHAALDQVGAPFRVGSVAELAAQQSRLPVVLDDRSAGTDLAACRFVAIDEVAVVPALGRLEAVLVDAAGDRALLALPLTPRVRPGAGRTADLLRRWQQSTPDDLHVSGRWRWTPRGPVVTPLLLAGAHESVQPFVAEPLPEAGQLAGEAIVDDGDLTSPAAVVRGLDKALGETLVAGLDRLGGDPQVWPALARHLRAAGSARLADLAEVVARQRSATAVARLLVAASIARPMV